MTYRVAIRVALLVVMLAGCREPSSVALAPATPLAMYPTPLELVEQRVALPVASACLDAGPFGAALDAAWPTLRAAAGLQPPGDGGCDLTLAFDRAEPPDLDAAARATWDAAGVDRYLVLGRLAGGRALARLYAESDRAASYALAAALARYDRALYHPAVIVDGAGIAERGVVEGHYGPPLAPAERLCLLAAMERLHHNLYLYAPKDDPYHRARWADLYPLDQARLLADTAAAAHAHHVDFMWSVSPGVPETAVSADGALSFASEADFERLKRKITAVRALGIDRFALLLDDTKKELSFDADRAAFPSLAAAHAELANRLDAWLVATGAQRLWFVGPYYSSHWDGWQAYTRDLGARLRGGIAVMWTGPHVYSPSIAAADLGEIDDALGRKVVIWDNEPESPAALEGRGHDLADGVSGYLTNTVMLQKGYAFADLWRVFGPVGDFAWNPMAYDPEASLSSWSGRAGVCP
ncbi:MAG: beta-N-acetylglucosaminidase [Myxococcales bacterium]|nr:beta-N-acetylglucosaminidase [Myxococcales bacterium]